VSEIDHSDFFQSRVQQSGALRPMAQGQRRALTFGKCTDGIGLFEWRISSTCYLLMFQLSLPSAQFDITGHTMP
jgi:hypothetical protein